MGYSISLIVPIPSSIFTRFCRHSVCGNWDRPEYFWRTLSTMSVARVLPGCREQDREREEPYKFDPATSRKDEISLACNLRGSQNFGIALRDVHHNPDRVLRSPARHVAHIDPHLYSGFTEVAASTAEYMILPTRVDSQMPLDSEQTFSSNFVSSYRWQVLRIPTTPKCGAKMAEEPYGVKYRALENEVWGPWQVGQMNSTDDSKQAYQWAKVLRLLDPKIYLVSCGGITFSGIVVIANPVFSDAQKPVRVLQRAGIYSIDLSLHDTLLLLQAAATPQAIACGSCGSRWLQFG
ncbi:hypothetical protein B0H10DRAFT_2332090 [Mycena sp. CBHHK59/15]|nr:hypothetical protein B0H10DRAFT_2332090 [Mycena sp. CBHHK59/15]